MAEHGVQFLKHLGTTLRSLGFVLGAQGPLAGGGAGGTSQCAFSEHGAGRATGGLRWGQPLPEWNERDTRSLRACCCEGSRLSATATSQAGKDPALDEAAAPGTAGRGGGGGRGTPTVRS